MATVYFPSCKFKAGYPCAAEKIQFYLNNHFHMNITGCANHLRLGGKQPVHVMELLFNCYKK